MSLARARFVDTVERRGEAITAARVETNDDGTAL